MGKILENVGINIKFDDFDITILTGVEVVALGAIMDFT